MKSKNKKARSKNNNKRLLRLVEPNFVSILAVTVLAAGTSYIVGMGNATRVYPIPRPHHASPSYLDLWSKNCAKPWAKHTHVAYSDKHYPYRAHFRWDKHVKQSTKNKIIRECKKYDDYIAKNGDLAN